MYRKKQLVVDRDETISQLKLQLSDATRELDEQLSSHAKKREAVLADKDKTIKVRFKKIVFKLKKEKKRIFLEIHQFSRTVVAKTCFFYYDLS